jgi:predicted AAA+ superfamily ATPase
MEAWLTKANRKPIILRGARQTGKSTLVRLFAEKQGLNLTEINLEKFPELSQDFAKKDPQQLINLLEALPKTQPITEQSILFLDEIQAVPEALPALRYFYEEMADLPVVAAGSLLEFALSDHRFSMPVGRIEYLHMTPMRFTEFLEAIDELKLLSIIKQYEIGNEIHPLIHQRLLSLLRAYFFVGGMPEAVKVYAQTLRFKDVSDVHNSIIETYREDFPKYLGNRNLSRVKHVFNFAARNIGKKVKYSHFSKQDQSATIKKDIDLLCMARVLSKVVHSHCNGLPLQAEMEEKHFKLLFLDVGLMNAICGLNWNTIESLEDHRLVNEGTIAEQFIGQHLQALLSDQPNRDLTYWLREGKANNAELDYVIGVNGKILPIEIKAGAAGSLKSLHQFVAEKQVDTAIRFDTGLPSLQNVETEVQLSASTKAISYQLISLPLYLVERIKDLKH